MRFKAVKRSDSLWGWRAETKHEHFVVLRGS
jgi:hypothetical protein